MIINSSLHLSIPPNIYPSILTFINPFLHLSIPPDIYPYFLAFIHHSLNFFIPSYIYQFLYTFTTLSNPSPSNINIYPSFPMFTQLHYYCKISNLFYITYVYIIYSKIRVFHYQIKYSDKTK